MKVQGKGVKKGIVIASMAVMAISFGDSFFNEVQASTYGNCGGAPYDKYFNISEGANGCHGVGSTCKTC